MTDVRLLNVGCGHNYHRKWVNLDYVATGPGVIEHDVRKGLPFDDNSFDAVYHSHVLEHLEKERAPALIKECYRVLKPGGILRVAVPDLEQITRLYLENLELALNGDSNAAANYDWMMLELYDQTVREVTGGGMAKYLQAENLANEDFVFQRIGREGIGIRDEFLASGGAQHSDRRRSSLSEKLKRLLVGADWEHVKTGKFRNAGELHKWMYDRYSLSRLLKEAGFVNPEKKSAFESAIPAWESYELDGVRRVAHKPDSLFMEVHKPK